jgi:hypothetical protein
MGDDLTSLGNWRWQASLGDIANTVFWSVVIWSLARLNVLRFDVR